MSTKFDYTTLKRTSKRARIECCPKCKRMAQKRSSWLMKDGSRNTFYVHAGEYRNGFPFVTDSCVVSDKAMQS